MWKRINRVEIEGDHVVIKDEGDTLWGKIKLGERILVRQEGRDVIIIIKDVDEINLDENPNQEKLNQKEGELESSHEKWIARFYKSFGRRPNLDELFEAKSNNYTNMPEVSGDSFENIKNVRPTISGKYMLSYILHDNDLGNDKKRVDINANEEAQYLEFGDNNQGVAYWGYVHGCPLNANHKVRESFTYHYDGNRIVLYNSDTDKKIITLEVESGALNIYYKGGIVYCYEKEKSQLNDRNLLEVGTQEGTRNLGKSQALKILGLDKESNLETTFASTNKANGLFWANPNVNYLNKDWALLLNDRKNKQLHYFRIPKNALQANQLKVRADKNLLDLQINYDGIDFIDTRSKVRFNKWFVRTEKY